MMNCIYECGGKYLGLIGICDVIFFLCLFGICGNSIMVKKIKKSFLMNLCEVEVYGYM